MKTLYYLFPDFIDCKMFLNEIKLKGLVVVVTLQLSNNMYSLYAAEVVMNLYTHHSQHSLYSMKSTFHIVQMMEI